MRACQNTQHDPSLISYLNTTAAAHRNVIDARCLCSLLHICSSSLLSPTVNMHHLLDLVHELCTVCFFWKHDPDWLNFISRSYYFHFDCIWSATTKRKNYYFYSVHVRQCQRLKTIMSTKRLNRIKRILAFTTSRWTIGLVDNDVKKLFLWYFLDDLFIL